MNKLNLNFFSILALIFLAAFSRIIPHMPNFTPVGAIALFGGAYVVGLACALAPAGVAVWTPSELYGARGLKGPLSDAIALLASCAGERVQKAVLINGTAELIIGQKRILANLTREPQFGLLPYEFKAT